ncbi:MAG: tetratricopeptide repeat protein [Alphaproteobacteria bacterium]|nr:tetratricopeptide repeat protein [Alphaproteobacteria bacterium]
MTQEERSRERHLTVAPFRFSRGTIAAGLGAALFAGLVATQAEAQTRFSEMPVARAYQGCMALARSKPSEGFEAAIAWRDEGGGPPARHCTAIALVGLGQLDEAAQRLEKLAQNMNGFGAKERAAVLDQAAQVWLRLGDGTRAYAALTAALKLDDSNSALWVRRGEVLARAGEYWDAIDDFGQALDRDSGTLDALIFRAAAYRLLEVPDLAADDLTRALALDPSNPEALTELGMVRRDLGDRDGARQAWLAAINAAPGSAAAGTARAALQRMDLKPQ